MLACWQGVTWTAQIQCMVSTRWQDTVTPGMALGRHACLPPTPACSEAQEPASLMDTEASRLFIWPACTCSPPGLGQGQLCMIHASLAPKHPTCARPGAHLGGQGPVAGGAAAAVVRIPQLEQGLQVALLGCPLPQQHCQPCTPGPLVPTAAAMPLSIWGCGAELDLLSNLLQPGQPRQTKVPTSDVQRWMQVALLGCLS